jgi:Lrp/AsnC family transcriptional regulator, leucine-responsive regulatory protein
VDGDLNLDGTDLEIVDLLVRDGRRTLADVGKVVSLSAPAVKRRMDHLVEVGVIKGFTAVVDHEKLGRPIEAFTELRFGGKTKVADIAGIARDLPEVDAVYTTAGDPDALAHLRVRDVADLTRVIDLLRRSGRITGTKTLMVLGTETKADVADPRTAD